MSKKIIIFGGSFDPIHNGHLHVARYAIDHFDADELIFVPAKRSPHKHRSPSASGEDRYNMIALAIAGFDKFKVTDCELQRPEPSFTIDTIISLAAQYEPDTIIYLLIGADGARDLYKWYRISDLLQRCNISLMYRPGFDIGTLDRLETFFGSEIVAQLKKNVLPNPEIDISSTEIRGKLADNSGVGDLLPDAVLKYIKTHRLYGVTGDPT